MHQALAVLLGSVARIPIGDLLIASIVPAFILAGLFFAYVIVRCALDPRLAPPYDVARLSLRERVMPFVKYVLPLACPSSWCLFEKRLAQSKIDRKNSFLLNIGRAVDFRLYFQIAAKYLDRQAFFGD